MRQRISTACGLVIALLLAVGSLFGGSVAAAAQNGLQGDDSYESPQFGYTVEWGDDWDVRARDVISNRGGFDTLTLRGTLGTLWIQGQGTKVTAAEAVQSRVKIEGRERDIVTEQLDGDVPMTEMMVGRNKILIEGYTLDTNQAVVVIVLSARERDFDDALASVHEQVLFNDGPILTGLGIIEGNGTETAGTPESETPTRVPERDVATVEATATAPNPGDGSAGTSNVVDGHFTGSVFGYSFDFDPAIWEISQEISSDESDGLQLVSDTGALTIWSWSGYGADPVACLDGEADYYASEDAMVKNWTPAEDANGDPIRYETGDYAYGVFTLTYTDPEDDSTSDLVDYVECRTIPGEDATVIIFGSSTPDMYNDHLDTVLDVAETITFTNEEPSTVNEPASTPAANEMPETGLSGSFYTSPSFGFTVDIPPQWQVQDEQLAQNDERILLTNGTSDVMIWATDTYDGDLAGCVDFAAESAPYPLELAETAEGKPFRGDDRNGAYGNFLYDNGDEAYSISCQYIEDGESVLIVTQDVPADELASQRKFRIDLQQSIELP